MDRMIKAVAIAWLTVSALAGMTVNAALADSSMYKNYARVNLGMNDNTGDLDDAGYGTGIDVGAVYGRYLGGSLMIECGINYFQTNHKINGSTAVAGSYTRKDSITVSSVLTTLKKEFSVGSVALYGGAGVGGYFVSLYSDIETSLQGDYDKDDDDIAFGAHIVAGGYYDITPRFFVGVEGMYRWTGDIDIQDKGAVPVQVKGDLNGYTVTAVLAGFRF